MRSSPSLGADTLTGGAGLDTAEYEGDFGGVRVDLSAGQGFFDGAPRPYPVSRPAACRRRRRTRHKITLLCRVGAAKDIASPPALNARTVHPAARSPESGRLCHRRHAETEGVVASPGDNMRFNRVLR